MQWNFNLGVSDEGCASEVYASQLGLYAFWIKHLQNFPTSDASVYMTMNSESFSSLNPPLVVTGPEFPQVFAGKYPNMLAPDNFSMSDFSEPMITDATDGVTELPRSRPRPRLHRPHLPSPPPASATHVSRLYPELLALIFERLPVADRGRAAQVCSVWRDAADRRSVWRGVEAPLHLRRSSPALLQSLARRGVRRVKVLSLRRGLRDLVTGLPALDSLSLSGCCGATDNTLAHALSSPLPSLRSLDLSLCKQLSDASLGRVARALPNLEELNLAGCCNVTNAGMLLVAWGLRRLKKLDLRSCWHVGDQGVSHLAGLTEAAGGTTQLTHLGLQDCQRLTDEALRHVASGLPELECVNLSFCASVTDAGLRHLAKLPKLRELNLRACDNISDAGVAHLAEGGSRLSSLDVSFCDKVGDRALAHISQGLFHIRAIHLSSCRITDDGLEKLARAIPDLEALHIGQCAKITDKSLNIVAECLPNLKCIDLYGCSKVSQDCLNKIKQLPRLGQNLNLGLWF